MAFPFGAKRPLYEKQRAPALSGQSLCLIICFYAIF